MRRAYWPAFRADKPPRLELSEDSDARLQLLRVHIHRKLHGRNGQASPTISLEKTEIHCLSIAEIAFYSFDIISRFAFRCFLVIAQFSKNYESLAERQKSRHVL
jgi:hypothetical protein